MNATTIPPPPPRMKPANRRRTETHNIMRDDMRYHVTFSRVDGRVIEVFCAVKKPGSPFSAILQDVCILISIALQSGLEPAWLADRMGRLSTTDDDGRPLLTEPHSFIGMLLDLAAKPEAEAVGDGVRK